MKLSLLVRDKIVDPDKVATFDPSRFDITGADESYLAKLGTVLSEKQNLFTQVIVHGFADHSGQVLKNQELSEERAQAVRQKLLADSKLNEGMITTIGEGSAYSHGRISRADRRVELEFIGVKDEDSLKQAIAKIK